MMMHRSSAETILWAILFSSAVLGTIPSADMEQELFHIWTPEPELATATACMDNEYGGKRSDDPNRQQKVPLPASVRSAICDLTSRTFGETLYEGPTTYASLFGPVHRLTIPDNPKLHLYVYQLQPHPELSWRYSIALVLHDIRNNTVSLVPAQTRTDSQNYCPLPWIRFQDVMGDEAMEILLLTGHHHGTGADEVLLHVLHMEDGLELNEVLTLRTAILMPYDFPGETLEEKRGFAVRTLNKVGPSCVTICVSLSRNKLAQGERILGFETWERAGENGRMYRTALNKIVDKDYRYVFQ